MKLPFSKYITAQKAPTSFQTTQVKSKGIKGSEIEPTDFIYHDVRIVANDGTVIEGDCFSVDFWYDATPVAKEDKLCIRLFDSPTRTYLSIGPSEIDVLYDLGAYAEW